MAWATKKQFAILMNSEEGKDLAEKLPDMNQDEFNTAFSKLLGQSGATKTETNDKPIAENKKEYLLKLLNDIDNAKTFEEESDFGESIIETLQALYPEGNITDEDVKKRLKKAELFHGKMHWNDKLKRDEQKLLDLDEDVKKTK